MPIGMPGFFYVNYETCQRRIFLKFNNINCRICKSEITVLRKATEREEKMSNKTKKLTFGAMLCAMAFVLVVVIRVPVVLFLKYEPKDIVITLGGLIWGPGMAAIVSCVVSLIEMFTISDTGIIGCIMNILSTCTFACTAAAMYKKKRTLGGAVAGLLLGSVFMTVVMLLWNYLVTPIYMGYPREEVAKLLVPAFLPFNALKAGLNAGFTFLFYKPIVTALRKAGLVENVSAGMGGNKKSSIGVTVVAVLVIVTCVLYILAMRGIL